MGGRLMPKSLAGSSRNTHWPHIHQLMQAKHQTLIQLWEEYRSICPADAFCYSQFTHYYRQYVKPIDVSMRQYYAPGKICFVDFACRGLIQKHKKLTLRRILSVWKVTSSLFHQLI